MGYDVVVDFKKRADSVKPIRKTIQETLGQPFRRGRRPAPSEVLG